MFNRKEIYANQRRKNNEKKYDENEVIYSLKRKMGEIGAENICIDLNLEYILDLSNEEEIMRFYKQRKYVQVGMNELIAMTEAMSFDQNQQKIVILQKITEEQKSYYQKREQLSQNLRQNVKNELFSRNRTLFQQNQQIEKKSTIIPLINEDNILFCHNQNANKQVTQQYETEEDDFYIMKTVKKEDLGEINKLNTAQLDTRTMEKYFVVNPYEEEEPIDSEDSQRTDNSKFDYPEDEGEQSDQEYDNDNDDDDDNDDYDRQMDSDNNQKQMDCQEDIEIDEEQNQKIDGGADFLNFLQLHKKYIQEKQNWRTFQYENDF